MAGINRFVIPSLSFVGGKSWVAFANVPSRFAWDQAPELPFEVSALGETLRLYDASSNLVDAVSVGLLTSGASAGRLPDGRGEIVGFAIPSPMAANLADSDGDGLPDAWELANGMDPRDSSDAGRDIDGDGSSNRDEFAAGTDPKDARSVLRLSVVRGPDGEITVAFDAMAGHAYRVEGSDDGGRSWVDAVPPIAAPVANGVVRVVVGTGGKLDGARLLRLSTPR